MTATKMPAIILDMDGVITDTEPLHYRAERRALEEYGLMVPSEEWANFKGKTEVDIFTYLFGKYAPDRPAAEIPALISRKTDLYIEMAADDFPAVPGSVDFLTRVREYFDKVGLATSSNRRVQQYTFERLGIRPYFDFVTTGEEVGSGHGKPHPEIYQIACRKAGRQPADCLVLEDSDNGVRAAAAAGCRTVGITTSFGAAFLNALGAQAVVGSFAELERQLAAGSLFK